MSYGLGSWSVGRDIRWVVLAYSFGLFLCCMFCHGELARRKPHPQYLTSFYLTISAGGALGSAFVVLAAPNMFSFYFELPIGLIFCAFLLFWVNMRRWWVTDVIGAALIIRLLVIAVLYVQFYAYPEGIRKTVRNFYGHQRVVEYNKGTEKEYRALYHGTISHGVQFMSPEKRFWPVAYFGPASGIGLAIKQLPEKARRVGILGLGVGTLAAYARPGDTYKYYEINPQVEDLARNEFYYVSGCRGNIEIKLGDGRLLLEKEESQQFDLLVIDAFSGDSVPMHLLTIEAMKLYLSHLKPGGILAFNVSNIYLDLAPVVDKAAKELGKYTLVVENQEDEKNLIYSAEWVLVASESGILQRPALKSAGKKIALKPNLRLWTDNYSNLFQAFQ
jgi:spermidine synthase